MANERVGHLILGVTNKPPRRVVGTNAFSSTSSLNAIKSRIVDKLKFRVDVTELQHPDGRVLVFEIPSRLIGNAVPLDGAYLMRSGESLTAMTPDMLKRTHAEDTQHWFAQSALSNVSSEAVIARLDTQGYFELMGQPYPTTRYAVLERLESQGFVSRTAAGWTITISRRF